MKKLSITIIGIFLLIIFPLRADAVSMSASMSCSNVVAGQTATCTLSGSSSSLIAGIEANIGVSGGTVESISAGSGWQAMENSNSYFAYYATGAGRTGSFTIATIRVKTGAAGTVTVSANGIKYNDGEDEASTSARGSFQATAPQTQPPQTQAPRPTTKATSRPTTAQPTAPVTEPVGTELKLDTVKVGDFEVMYQEGKYYVTVNYDTESVNVEATANPNITLIGGGVRTLAVGKNIVEIIMRNEINQSASAQIIITRPEDTNDYSTYLTELKVVDYDLSFNKDILEYTVYVPANVKEIYVLAKSDNVNVSIMGDGLQTLQSGDNDIHVKVQYGNKAETNYVIHIKRSYTSVIMWGVIATLSAGLIGSILYFTNRLKNVSIANKEEKTKILAEANRTVAESKENATLNGVSVVAPASVAAPQIQRNATPVQQAQQATSQNVAVNGQRPTVQVVEKRVPTNPTAVATSTTNPTQVKPNAPTQVKLVQTLDRQPIKVNRTQVNTNGAKQVVINTGKQK